MRLIKLLFTEAAYFIRMLIFLSLIGAMGWQVWTINAQEDKIAYLKGQKRMVQSEMIKVAEKKIKGSFKDMVKKEPQPQIPEINYILEGTTIQDGDIHALINGIIYTKGDALDNFVVDEITLHYTTIRNPSTEETKTIRFKGEDYFPVQ